MRLEELGKLEKVYLIVKRSRDLPVYSIVPQPLRYRVPHVVYVYLLEAVPLSVDRSLNSCEHSNCYGTHT
jgi:hypothetical protein